MLPSVSCHVFIFIVVYSLHRIRIMFISCQRLWFYWRGSHKPLECEVPGRCPPGTTELAGYCSTGCLPYCMNTVELDFATLNVQFMVVGQQLLNASSGYTYGHLLGGQHKGSHHVQVYEYIVLYCARTHTHNKQYVPIEIARGTRYPSVTPILRLPLGLPIFLIDFRKIKNLCYKIIYS